MAGLIEELNIMQTSRISLAFALFGGISLLIAVVVVTSGPGPATTAPLLDAAVDPLRKVTTDDEGPVDSSLDPDAVTRLRTAISAALAGTGVDTADAATHAAVEYALGVADGDIDRLAGLALEHGAKPSASRVAFYRGLADARPDRLRPRDVETWNSVQVLRWGAMITARARWEGVAFDSITAEVISDPSQVEALSDMTPPDGSGLTIGYAPMSFPLPDIARRFQQMELRGVVLTIPAALVNGDRTVTQAILVEYEPGKWYPIGARVTVKEGPESSSVSSDPERRPRPM